jgi:HSP20 family molecular chaperone IbpA
MEEKMFMWNTVDDIFSNVLGALDVEGGKLHFPVDRQEDKEKLTFVAEMPGMEVDVSVDGNTLLITGEKVIDRDKILYKERIAGSFKRSFRLPVSADKENVSAVYKKGVLTVTIAKSKGFESGRVKVNVEE